MMTTEVLFYQFDDVVIDLRAGRVSKAGAPVPLEPKAYDLLVLLASRQGALVTKQEVLDTVWAGVYVTDNAVARVVAQIRRNLGDVARGARYIETVPTRGYRFIGPVTRVGHPPAAAPPRPPGGLPAESGPPGAGGTAPLIERRARVSSGAPNVTSPISTPHPIWAAGFALLALLALVLAWRSSTIDGTTRAPRRTQITSSAALDAFPVFSPDGSALAYASDRGGSFEVFIRDIAAGGDRLAITSDGQHNVQPAWSPDGAHVAYHSSGRGGIWVVARDGGVPRQVSPFGSRPVWSPDGRRLAFQGAPYTEPSAAAFESFGPSSLWVVDVAGGQPRRVTEGWRPEGSHARPTWFPDGQRLFFASQGLNTTRFWIVDIESGVLTHVHDPGTRAVDPTLTPDGRTAYYVRLDDSFDLWRLPLTEDGTEADAPRRVLPPSELDVRHVAVHPDGRQIAYVAMATVSGLRSLAVTREGVPTGPSQRIAEDTVRTARRPSISPDGQAVTFERQSAGRPPGVWVLNLLRGAPRPLLQANGSVRAPVWSPDGTTVYVETGENDARALQAVQVDTGQTRLLLPLGDGAHDLLRPRLSPDGTRLAYTRSQEGQLEVRVRTLAGDHDERVARIGDGAAFPVWSPDGSALALDVWRDGHAQVHVVDLASRTSRQISTDIDQAWVRSWSPDGRQVAFAGSRDGRWNVWSAAVDGTQQRQLTDYGGEHHYVRNPEWSPNADRLVYEFASFTGNVWVVDAED